MRKYILAVCLILCTHPVYAEESDGLSWKWTTKNTVLELSLYTVAYLDLMQTYWMNHDNKWDRSFRRSWCCEPMNLRVHSIDKSQYYYRETNPLLGETPSRTKIFLGGCAMLAVQTAIAAALPHTYREYFQYVSIGLESANVANNAINGLKMETILTRRF